MDTTVVTPATDVAARASTALRHLYLARFTFAAVWAVLLFTSARTLGPLSVTLLLVYPLFDVGCAVIDARTTKPNGGPARALYANIALSTLAAAGLAAAASSGIPAVLRVWGLWAITAGLVQLIVGILRRGMTGQWPMIVSGALSTLAGGSFIAQAGKGDASLSALAGYGLLGGIFFLLSAFRLRRTTTR
ncbi:hypothetical protein AB0I66_00875 [Streptomyces sp. NPDC050439]|uniref:hypothetical protein n=1 Tax=unclassified Streptomyces TaxID=2593676 RepID=UPI003420A6FE